MIEVKFVKVDNNAILPTRNHNNLIDKGIPDLILKGTCDSGYDIYSIADIIIPAHGSAVVPVGLKVGYVSPGYWFKIESRSGLSFKYGIFAHPGIIDNQYRGDMGIKLYNHSTEHYQVKKGDKIAQLVLYPLIDAKVSFIDEAHETLRGEKGFGSSGK